MPTLSLLLLVTALAQAPPGRPYSEERQLLDRHLARLARALPDAPTPDADAATLQTLANETGLREVVIGPPTITESGSLGQSRRTLNATSTFPDADRFFRAVQGSPRLIDVESLTLRAAEFGVHIEARLRFYHRSAQAAPSAALDPAYRRDRTRGATREEGLRFARDEQLVLEKSIALDELRRKQASPRMFLAETGSALRDAAAALTFGSLEGETGRFALRGVAAGLGAAEALERRLEDGFFRVREFSKARKSGCYQFEVVGDSFRAGPQAALPLPVDEPFRPTEPFCEQDRDRVSAPAPVLTVRPAGAASGGITLRAVDADLADVADMLEALARTPIVVAGDVVGRISVDFNDLSLEEALKALPVSAVAMGGAWLLTSPSSPSPSPAEAGDDDPASRFSFRAKRARGEDVLAALAEAEPSFAALGPPILGKVSVFAHDASAAAVRRAVLMALELDESRDENSRILKLRGSRAEPVPIVAGSLGSIVFRASDLTIDELLLAGVGKSGDELLAFAYSPLGEIVTLRRGDALADGVVAALDTSGVLVDSSEGPVRISISFPASRNR